MLLWLGVPLSASAITMRQALASLLQGGREAGGAEADTTYTWSQAQPGSTNSQSMSTHEKK